MSEYLAASTDMHLIVEGVQLPCHKQILSLHSNIFAGMVDMTSSSENGAFLPSDLLF